MGRLAVRYLYAYAGLVKVLSCDGTRRELGLSYGRQTGFPVGNGKTFRVNDPMRATIRRNVGGKMGEESLNPLRGGNVVERCLVLQKPGKTVKPMQVGSLGVEGEVFLGASVRS